MVELITTSTSLRALSKSSNFTLSQLYSLASLRALLYVRFVTKTVLACLSCKDFNVSRPILPVPINSIFRWGRFPKTSSAS